MHLQLKPGRHGLLFLNATLIIKGAFYCTQAHLETEWQAMLLWHLVLQQVPLQAEGLLLSFEALSAVYTCSYPMANGKRYSPLCLCLL